ncbi:MAG: 16S rRNA (cytosine(967)-C(5))-methyltransferase RsmB [Clostridia bacterium]|nr:16S rRNA (cytosine(967)-C(5))-methyltransferase RsmB [Clostridia bacterium]
MNADRTALEIFLRITEEGAYANLALKDGLHGADRASASRITALVYTALEHMSWCDYMLAAFAKGRVQPKVRGILRLFSTELFFMQTPDHAVCSRAVALTKQVGKAPLSGFVNGVMRSLARARLEGSLPELPRDPAERLCVLTGCPVFMAREYIDDYGEEFAREMLTNRAAGIGLRPVYPHTSEELEAHLISLGLPYRRSALAAGAFAAERFPGLAEDELFRAGAFTVQSESAMLACKCLGVRPGMRVLDACAAPGGKTAYIADIMERTGRITAFELHPHRAELIRETLSRLGVTGVDIAVRDASVFDPQYEDAFDAVLVDAPCSGLGGGSKPEAVFRRTDSGIDELAELQYAILRACARYVRPGGTLVYSTCTLSRREDEQVTDRFLSEHAGFAPVPLGEFLPEGLRGRGEKGRIRLFPHVDGTEGFYIAKLERKL